MNCFLYSIIFAEKTVTEKSSENFVWIQKIYVYQKADARIPVQKTKTTIFFQKKYHRLWLPVTQTADNKIDKSNDTRFIPAAQPNRAHFIRL